MSTGLRALILPILALFALIATTATDLTRHDAEALPTHTLETTAAGARDATSAADTHSAISSAPTVFQLASIRGFGEGTRVDAPAPHLFPFAKHAARGAAPARLGLVFARHDLVFTHDGLLRRAGSLSSFGTSLPPPIRI